MLPLVSVIMPTFNRMNYLPAAIDSVFQQRFLDWELIIADDGSDRETRDYLRSLQGRPNVKVLWLPHTGNPAAVRNAALREATGEYVAFLDSDDVWLPQKLQVQIESLRAHSVREWSYTGFALTDGCGNRRSPARAARLGSIDEGILDQIVKEQAIVVTPSVLVRRELIERVGGFNSELLVGEDYELWVRLASVGKVDFVDQPLVLVRRHQQHSFDDITCLRSLMRAVEIIQRSSSASHLDRVLNRRRAKIAANLANAQAQCRHPSQVLITLASSFGYSWRYGDWWRGAVGATVRVFAPESALRAARKYRRGKRNHAEPRG
jgi:glycosyltransferase involved in cell wall biosynthesis